jgi:hypothetical protein
MVGNGNEQQHMEEKLFKVPAEVTQERTAPGGSRTGAGGRGAAQTAPKPKPVRQGSIRAARQAHR